MAADFATGCRTKRWTAGQQGRYIGRVEQPDLDEPTAARRPAAVLIEVLTNAERLQLEGPASEPLLDAIDRGLARGSGSSRAVAVMAALDAADEVDDYFFSDEELSELLEQF